ncbi:Phosphatidylinositol 5-phosphate 4-kinase type-2 alpha [Orchesella cincta]|uniref:1-phosphatidylinositol-5-phosphate 4-kinase n=1 Tax=Orchesella cincta TaxID=48709 RepID=A0A1D2NLC1_ORCCI|nr:Phosphatidylinositol 5-phosphate 4-kinase type-2 alpha [Orchesella cincta]
MDKNHILESINIKKMSAMASKLKKKRIRVKHQKVKVFRAKEPLMSVFMWGVNHTLNDLQHVNVPVMLMPDDFRSYSKIRVDNHLFNKENLPSHFKFKEYCPLVFRNLRERFGVDDQDLRESLTRSEPTPFVNPGKSGAKFYQSWDKLYIIKTLTSEEVEQMHALLKQYHPYIVERHGKTLLPQYLGMYRLTVDGVEHYKVITRNVFSNHLKIHRKYDLKGSTVDREASDKEKGKDLPTLKDNDFLKDGGRIYIGEEAKEKLMETLNADIGFLTKLHLMDYSLLLGVHDSEKAEQEERDKPDSQVGRTPKRGICLSDTKSRIGGSPVVVEGRLLIFLSPLLKTRNRKHMVVYYYGLLLLDENGLEEEEESDEANCPGQGVVPTPPESPSPGFHGEFEYDGRIIPDIDIYAIPSHASAPRKEIYFLAVIDVLTHYGVKKQAAKAAKTVKYGSNVEGISTCEPDQYAKRFIDFIQKAIE